MLFADIIGQEKTITHLRSSVNKQHIAHAQLFSGKSGHGTLALALAYARYIMCSHRTSEDACGTCPSCIKINVLAHPDLHFVFPVIKNQQHKNPSSKDFLPQWRELLTSTAYFDLKTWYEHIGAEKKQGMIYASESMEILHQLELQAYEAEYKITIIWMPETMHAVCSNKLLKLIEEPPAKTIFLLITEQMDQIIDTIISRTQISHIPPSSREAIQKYLTQQYQLDEKTALHLTKSANGDLCRIRQQLENQDKEQLMLKEFTQLMRTAYMKDIISLRNWSNQMANQGREAQKNFILYAQNMLRENFIYNLKNPDLNYMSIEEAHFSSRFSPFVNESNIYSLMDTFEQAQKHIEQNVYGKMVFFDLCIKLIMLLKSK